MNLFEYTVPERGETFAPLLRHRDISIQRIVSSEHQEAKIYIQEEDEWVVVLEGEALLQIDGVEKRLCRGESLLIPAKIPHRVLQTQRGTLWLAVHIHRDPSSKTREC